MLTFRKSMFKMNNVSQKNRFAARMAGASKLRSPHARHLRKLIAAQMKIVCICEDQTVANFILTGLVPEHEVPLVIIPEFGDGKASSWRGQSFRQLVSKLISKAFFSFVRRRPNKEKIDQIILSQQSASAIDQPLTPATREVRIPTKKINAKSTAQLIADYEPDMMFVCGAPILKPSIFEIPKYGSINFHFGYSPKYRGHHSLIWPFIKADYKNLGGTFLKIDRGIDTGTPLVFVFPEISGADTVASLEAKIAFIAKDSIGDAIKVASTHGKIDSPKSDEVFQVKYTDYSPLTHLRYFSRLAANSIFQKRQVLREQQVIPLQATDAATRTPHMLQTREGSISK